MTKSEPRRLTDQQRAFVQHYTVDFNATKAAIKAGYSEKSAARLGHELLNNPLVKGEIHAILKQTAKDHQELRYRIIRQLELQAFSSIKNYGRFDDDGLSLIPSEDLDDELASVIQEFHVSESKESRNVKFKLAPKDKALEMLGRHLGMFTDKIQVEAIKPFAVIRSTGEVLELGAKVEEKED